jgi:hypothetical protein
MQTKELIVAKFHQINIVQAKDSTNFASTHGISEARQILETDKYKMSHLIL